MNKLDIYYLEKQLPTVGENSSLGKVISIFLQAINDWRVAVFSVEEYLDAIKRFTNSELTKEGIETAVAQVSVSNFAWEVESLAELMDVFKYYEAGISLEVIVADLREKLDGFQ